MKKSILKRRYMLRIITFIFTLLGFFISLFLTYEYSLDAPVSCGGIRIGNANSCESVRGSAFSSMFGIDIPIWGAIFFVILLTLLFIYISKFINRQKECLFSQLFLIIVSLGAIFETSLTYIELFVIHSICIWCLLIEIIVMTIFLITLLEFIFSRRAEDKSTHKLA